MGLPYRENFVILTSTVFLRYTHLVDRQTDGQRAKHIWCRTLKMVMLQLTV